MEMNASYTEITYETSSDSAEANRDDVLFHLTKNDDIRAVATTIISPFGLLFNAAFLFVVIRVKSMRTIINVYLSNLAVADAALLIWVELTSWDAFDQKSGVGFAVTGIGPLLQVASYCFITVVAVERCSAIRHPMTFRAKASKKRAAKISAGLWVLAVVAGVVERAVIYTDNVRRSTVKIHNVKISLFLVVSAATFAVTLLSYIYIIVKLRHQAVLAPNNPPRAWRVARMLSINTAVFFLLKSVEMTVVVTAIIRLNATLSETDIFRFVWVGNDQTLGASILAVVNSSINPLVYSMTNEEYRAAVLQAFPFLNRARRCLRRHRRRRRRRRRHRQRQPNGTRVQQQIELKVIRQRDGT